MSSGEASGCAVVQRLLRSYETYFDVSEDYQYEGRTFAGYAEFHSHGEQYVLAKRAKLWEVDVHEYAFFHCASELSCSEFDSLIRFMTEKAIGKVEPVPNHMSSCLTLVVVAGDASDEVKRRLRKTRFRKNFAFGFRGWVDLRLALVCLDDSSVTTNAAGKMLRDTISASVIS